MNLPRVTGVFAAATKKASVLRTEAGEALHRAIWARDARALQDILSTDQGRAVVEYRDTFGNTPLLNAVEYGFSAGVRMLLDASADAHATGWRGITALEVAELDTKITSILTPRANARFDEFDRSAFRSFQEIREMLSGHGKNAPAKSKIAGIVH